MEVVAKVFETMQGIFEIVINFIKELFASVKPEDTETTGA